MARQESQPRAGEAPAGNAATAAGWRFPRLAPLQWPVFASLRHRNYFLLWLGSLFGNTGDWMDQVALNWLVWQLTHDPVALALLIGTRVQALRDLA